MKLEVILSGRMSYGEAYKLQSELQKQRTAGEIPDTLVLLEHPPVITIGKRGTEADLLLSREMLTARGIEIYETNRGGEVTYHGPGQVVGYLIFDITEHGKDLHLFVHSLEQIFIDLLLDNYGIAAGRDSDYTGVWVGDKKITAIGIAVRKWISMHGFAFNACTNLDHFSLIVPCGIRDKGVTSLSELTTEPVDMDELREQILKYCINIYGFTAWKEKHIQARKI